MKRIISIVLSIVILLSMCVIGALPANAASQIDSIISIARSKIGYYSRPNEFTYWYGSLSGYADSGYNYPWCAAFVSWCANQAGVPTSVIPKHCGCTAGMQWFKNNKRWEYSVYYGGSYTPKAGDIVYYTNNCNTNVSDHVGIVTGVNGNYLTVIEGNTEGQVKEYTKNTKRQLNSSYVIGYGIPAYNSTGCTCSDSYAGGYTVTTSSQPLTMRSGHSTGYSVVTSIPKGEQVYVSKADGTWAHVEWKGYVGFCSMQYLTKIVKKSAPSGYNISVSPSSFYDNEVSTVTITPFDSNITNYKLHFITPDGRYTSPDLGDKNYFNFVCRGVYGTWKVYAEITNDGGTFCGSETNGCVTFDINEVKLGSPVDLGTNFYAQIGCAATNTILTHDPTWSDYTNVYMDNGSFLDNQFFKFVRQSDGSYVISSKKDANYCLDVNNNGFVSETNVGVYPANGSNAQKWNIYSAGNGYYYFRPYDYNSAMLDVEGASSESGANVQLYTYNATNAQKFSITKVTDTTKPTATISSTNNVSSSQTLTFTFYDNKGIVGYYWGTNSAYDKNNYFMGISSQATQNVSSPGTYYLTVKDTSGNLSETASVTFYKTTLNANGGNVSTSSILTRSGNSVTLPVPTRSGYSFIGWGTSSLATSGVKTITPSSNKSYYAVWSSVDSTKPTVSVSSTNNIASSQAVTLAMSDNIGVVSYYWGTSSSPADSSFTTIASATSKSVTKTVSDSGTYYLIAKDVAGNTQTTKVTFYKTTLNANGGSVAPTSVLTKSGNSVVLPVPTNSGFTFEGWGTSSSATSGINITTPSSNKTYYAVWVTVDPEFVLGDVNNDGTVDAGDAVLISRYDAGMVDLNSSQLKAGDVNGDGTVDAGDAVLISRYDAGFVSKLG